MRKFRGALMISIDELYMLTSLLVKSDPPNLLREVKLF